MSWFNHIHWVYFYDGFWERCKCHARRTPGEDWEELDRPTVKCYDIAEDKKQEAKMTEPANPTAEEIVANAESGVQAIIDAWQNPGPGRVIQYRAKRALWNTWPTMALAIERLIDENR